MTRIIVEFWPIFIPLLIFAAWYLFFRRRNTDNQKRLSPEEGKLLILALLTSVVIIIMTLIYMAFTTESNKGVKYEPPHMEDGKLIPGKMIKNDGK